jgi:hypothetical protein
MIMAAFSLTLLFTANAQIYSTDLDGRASIVAEHTATAAFGFAPPVQMPGWPKYMGVHPNYKPSGVCFADLEGDGDLEIIAGSTDGLLYAWDHLGNDLPGWPITLPALVQAKVAAGDLDNNGDLEVVAAARNGYVYAYHHDATQVSGWPQNANGVLGLISPTLFDLDRNGDLEVIMVQMQSGQPGHVYVWHHNGQIYTGWPKNMDYLGVATAAVADIDNDSLFEIVALSYYSIYAWDQNGNTEPGWPKLNVAGGMSYAQAVLADLDANNDLEILHSYYSSNQNYVGIYHHDGTNFASWPQTYPGPQTYTTPVVSDLDGDADLEIFGGGHVIGGPSLSARHVSGSPLSGWPVQVDNLECSPIVLDVDADGGRETVVGDNMNPGHLYAFEAGGSYATDWPVTTTAAAGVNSAQAGDVDQDGDLEIGMVLMDGTVNLWTLDSVPYRPYLTEWGTYFHDQWNTGWFHPKAPLSLSVAPVSNRIQLHWRRNREPDVAGYAVYRSLVTGGPYARINPVLAGDTSYTDSTVASGVTYYYCVSARIKADAESRLSNEASGMVGVAESGLDPKSLISITPNPFRHATWISVGIKDEGLGLCIYDAGGRLVNSFDLRNTQYAIRWSGTDQNGQSVPAGIYFAGIKTPSGMEIKKIIKIR